MHRIVLASLLHRWGRTCAALVGVAFASMMVLVQAGVYVGFLDSASGIIPRIGGDVWVMSRGTPAVDLGATLAPSVRLWAQAHPCVARARPLIVEYASYRTGEANSDSLLLVGEDLRATPMVPWTLARGLPQDLRAPLRLSIDESDLGKFDIHGDPIGAPIELLGRTAHVAAVSRGIRSFTTAAYAFMEIGEARRVLAQPPDAVRYWVLDLHHPACVGEVIDAIDRHPEVEALTTAAFRQRTEEHWIGVSGVGALLAFSSLLGFIVGAMIVAQTLFHVTQDHLPELGTLKALGALNREVVGFVVWQALFLAGGGCVIGLGAALAISAASRVLTITLSPGVVAGGFAAILVMCALASLASILRVTRLEPAEVFK